MVSLSDIASVLSTYRGRYEFLDAFVDDVQELKYSMVVPGLRLVTETPRPVLDAFTPGGWVRIEIFRDEGVARFRLLNAGQSPSTGDAANAAVVLGGILGGALGAATAKKEGLLGGVVLGILVGGLIGAAAAPVERAVALQFDPATASWRLYDGPLLGWAKRTLIPGDQAVG